MLERVFIPNKDLFTTKLGKRLNMIILSRIKILFVIISKDIYIMYNIKYFNVIYQMWHNKYVTLIANGVSSQPKVL